MLHYHKPVSEEQMKAKSPRYSICETLRQAYHLIDNDDAKIKLREATAMAKAMSRKIAGDEGEKWYVRDRMWGPNPNHQSYANWLKRPIDVLMICYDDFANTLARFWQCARYLGLNAIAVKGVKHPFRYPYQAPLHPSLMHQPISSAPLTVLAPGLEHLIECANVVHLFTSTYPMCAVNWGKHPVIVQHGGTYYRQHPKECNELFNQLAQKTVIQCPDLLGLGAKDETLIYYPVDTTLIQPDFSKKGDKLVVGHFPSNPKVKGSDLIRSVIFESPVNYMGPDGVNNWPLVPWAENLKRFKQCDVIVETLAAEQTGKKYGEWGNTALEAAASGCVIVSNCIHEDVYQKEYGDLGIHVANDAYSLKVELTRLSQLSDDDLMAEKKACRKWVEEKHSIPATAERLWNKIYCDYF